MTEREIDQLLDRAIGGYVAEPTPGLSERVLARCRRRRSGPIATVAVAAAAAAMLISSPWPSATQTVRVAPAPLVTQAAAVDVAPAATQLTLGARPGRRRAPAPRSVPISQQELQLLRFAQAYPELTRQAFVELPEQAREPLTVEPIVIAPLETSGSGGPIE